MKLIVGLGNNGVIYKNTRHNVGFNVVDTIANKMNIKLAKEKFGAIYYVNDDFVLMKPMSYMNLSGESVAKIMQFYKIKSKDILVICDDLDIKLGQAKIKISNSSGGHNGVENIIEQIKTSEFYRLKIGIGRPEDKDAEISNYVLEKFDYNQQVIIDQVIDKASDAAISIIYNGINYVINNFNKKPKNEN